MKEAINILPIYKVEQGCILSFSGDITLAYKLVLPEIFSLSDRDYEAYHQAWVKAIKVLPAGSILHKQDWFLQENFKADFGKEGRDFLSRSSELFFNERPFVEHSCCVFLTKKSAVGKSTTSATSGLFRGSLVPPQTLNPATLSDFLDKAGRFERILSDSGFVSLLRQDDDAICGTANAAGILERYCFLLGERDMPVIRDIHLKDEIRVGEKHMEIYTLSDVEDLLHSAEAG